MGPLKQLQQWRRRPTYQKVHSDPPTYLTTARLHLLRSLPPDHRLFIRATSSGTLKPQAPPDPPRAPFTEQELQGIKARRRYTFDPDDVRYQLQESKLVQMWNADYNQEDQWREYDEARPAMEVRRDIANLPDEAFDTDDVVGEKRKRVVSADYRPPVRQRMINDFIEEEDELKEGEIEEQSLRTLRGMNERLTAANAALRVMADELSEGSTSPPTSPPKSDQTESDGESDDSRNAICESDIDDSDDESSDGVSVHIDSWLDSLVGN